MSIESAEQKVKDAEALLRQARAELETEKASKKYTFDDIPNGTYIVHGDGTIGYGYRGDSLRKNGNIFKEKAHAKRRSNLGLVQNLLFRFKMELCPDFVENWKNHYQSKWYPYLCKGKLSIDRTAERNFGLACFDTEENARIAGQRLIDLGVW